MHFERACKEKDKEKWDLYFKKLYKTFQILAFAWNFAQVKSKVSSTSGA